MNAYTALTARFRGRRRPPLFQNITLHLERPDPPAQLPQLDLLITAQTRGTARVDLGLLDPVTQRLLGHAEIASDLPQRPTAETNQLNGLPPELRRIRRLRLRHLNLP